MITRTQMPRQLRNKGGITSLVPREKYGIGSTFQKFKDKALDRTRKLIPNELANVAVKAAPFVAPFYPGAAALMRGIGRFDQRGSLSDAFKQGIGTYAFGKGARFLAGAEGPAGGFDTFSKEGFRKGPVGRLFQGKTPGDDLLKTSTEEGTGFMKKAVESTIDKIPLADKLPQKVKEKLLVGGLTSGASALYSYFMGEFDEPQQPGETAGEYMARRNARVKQQMRMYMDSYYTPLRNPEYASFTPEQRDNFIDGIVGQTGLEGTTDYQGEAKATGGRVGYQTGGITMANTLAENIRRNIANQAAINQQLEQARTKIPTKAAPIKIQPSPKQNLTLKDVDQTGMPLGLARPGTMSPSSPIAPLTMPTPTRERVRYITETGEPASGPGPNVGTIIEREEFKPPKVDMTDPMFTGFDYSKPVNWSPGQPAPEGYRVVNMMGDEFLERKFPSKEEIARLPANFFDDFQQLPGPMGSGPLAPMVAPFEKYGITPEQYANMSPEDQEAVMNRVDRDRGIYGDNIGKRIYGIPDDEADDYGITFAKGGRVNFDEGGTGFMKWLKANYGLEVKDLDLEQYVKLSREFNNENPDPNETGRKKNAMGSMPVGIMRTNKAGVMERDYRDEGGFVPVGIKEKADDVPAMLSKNEFVFTADAVRGAGNGSIEKGAQRMYDTMKKLEKRVV